MKLPTLYYKSKHGKIYSWDIWTKDATIYSEAGTLDGKKILSTKVATPKNIGKSNATTAEQQAQKEAVAMHKFKLDRKYSLTPEEAQVVEDYQPMLAQDFNKRKKNVHYPVSLQPKLDGLRCLAYLEDDEVVLKSRGNKHWDLLDHIKAQLYPILRENSVWAGSMFDGELYIDGVDFQTLVSWAKRKQPDTTRIDYHIYDMPVCSGDMHMPWVDREQKLHELFDNMPGLQNGNIKHVMSVTCLSEEEVVTKQAGFVADGYEGAMVRTFGGIYNFGYRSYDLLKVKTFDDAEFEVVGFTNGVGKFSNSVIWICKTSDDKEFNVTPKCSQEQKEEYLRGAKQYVGKLLTVQYFGLSNEGVPRFPVGKGFRPEQDIDKNGK